jgi:dihydrofolate reductase
MIIAAIVATDFNNGIGKNNQLPWHLPADLKFFKNVTMGCPIIMGRKTYESIGKLLPGRKNIIITRNTDYKVVGAEIHTSIEGALQFYAEGPLAAETSKIFIIGGAELFKCTMTLVDEIYRTLIKFNSDADTFIPPISVHEFKMVWEECHPADEKNKYDYCFQKWDRK